MTLATSGMTIDLTTRLTRLATNALPVLRISGEVGTIKPAQRPATKLPASVVGDRNRVLPRSSSSWQRSLTSDCSYRSRSSARANSRCSWKIRCILLFASLARQPSACEAELQIYAQELDREAGQHDEAESQ